MVLDVNLTCLPILFAVKRLNRAWLLRLVRGLTLLWLQGEIGLNAAKMVMELVKDNRKIVDRITHKHIDTFVDLLQKNKVGSYTSELAKKKLSCARD